MVKIGICGKVMRVAPFRVCHFLLERVVSWYGAQILTHVDTLYLLLCGVVGIERSDKGPKGPGDGVFV